MLTYQFTSLSIPLRPQFTRRSFTRRRDLPTKAFWGNEALAKADLTYRKTKLMLAFKELDMYLTAKGTPIVQSFTKFFKESFTFALPYPKPFKTNLFYPYKS